MPIREKLRKTAGPADVASRLSREIYNFLTKFTFKTKTIWNVYKPDTKSKDFIGSFCM